MDVIASVADLLRDFFSDSGTVVLTVLGLVVGIPYVLGPILIKSTQKFRAIPPLRVFDPQQSPPPRQVAEFFDGAVRELESVGFSAVAHVAIPDMVPHVATLLVLLENRDTDDGAIVVSMHGMSDSGGGARRVQMQSHYVEISCEFVDGVQLSTNNSEIGPSFAAVPQRRIVQLPQIKSPARLYRLHQRAVEELATARRSPLPPREELVDHLGRDMTDEFETQIDTGYLFKTPGYYRPTWKGAILMTWKEVWPVNAIRRMRRRNRARQFLERWETHEPA